MNEKITRCIEKIREEQNFHLDEAGTITVTASDEEYHKWLKHMAKVEACSECIRLIMEVVAEV